MIFKKINEDFDFGSIEVTSSAASDYQQTPEMIRESANKDIDIEDVFIGKFGITLPRGVKHKQIIGDGVGPFVCAYNVSPAKINCHNGFSSNDISKLKATGMEMSSYCYSNNRDGTFHPEDPNIPNVVFSIIKYFLGYEGDFTDIININLNYFKTPDDGIIIFNKIHVRVDIKSKNVHNPNDCIVYTSWNGEPYSYEIVLRRVITYTGNIIYHVKKPDAKTMKDVKSEAAAKSRSKTALYKLIRKDKLNIYQPDLGDMIELPNGKGLIFPYYYRWSRFSWKSAMKRNCNGIVAAALAGNDLQHDVMAVIEKIDMSDPGNIRLTCGYTGSTTKGWYAYLMTDQNQVVKLLGSEIAEKIKPMKLSVYDVPGATGKWTYYKAYSFIFVPEPNAQVIRDAAAGKLKLKDI